MNDKTPLRELKGVGEKTEKLFQKIGITTAEELLRYYPRTYDIYEEPVEGMAGTVRNTIKITGDSVFEIIKSGLASAHMVFEKDKINMTQYETPYGELLIGIHTRKIDVDVTENNIAIAVNYALDINDEKVADCNIDMNIKALER